MLDLLEKIAAGVVAVASVLTLALYIAVGVPSTTSVEFLGKARVIKPTPVAEASGAPSSEPPSLSAEEERIAKQLREQGRPLARGQRVSTMSMAVPEDLFEHISSEANWGRELKKAHSSIIQTKNGDTRLRLYKIEENSLFKSFGFQEDDVVELIDGEIVEFRESSSHKYYSMAKSFIEKLRGGEEISVTVTRKNRPVHIKFRVGD